MNHRNSASWCGRYPGSVSHGCYTCRDRNNCLPLRVVRKAGNELQTWLLLLQFSDWLREVTSLVWAVLSSSVNCGSEPGEPGDFFSVFTFDDFVGRLWTSYEIDLNRPISAQKVRLGGDLLWCQMTPFEGRSLLAYQCVLSFSLQYSATFDSFAPGNHILLLHGDLPPYPDILIRCGSRLGQSLLSLPLPSRDKGCDWFFNSQSGQLTYLGMYHAHTRKYVLRA